VHIFNHAMIKTTLFMVLGAVFYRIGSVQVADMAGIGRRMPLTMAAFTVAGLGLIGIPGTAGFISKWYLVIGAIERGYWPVVVLVVASSLLAVIYVGRVVESAYFREPSKTAREATDPPALMLVPIAVLAALSVYFGLDTRLSAGLARGAAEMVLGGTR
jgi:multicomponent Na+:H+ antiporter subunit D